MFYVNNISLHFGDRILFDDVTFVLSERDRVGLVGKNGVGKTTLFKVITGHVIPDTGSIDTPKNFTTGYLKQDIDFSNPTALMEEVLSCNQVLAETHQRLDTLYLILNDRTDYESAEYTELLHEISDLNNAYAILEPDKFEAEAEKVMKGLGFKPEDFSKPVSSFSGGWKMRIELAKLLLTAPNILLLDEPTNHLDIESIIWLENYLKNYAGIVFVISHDKQFLNNVCTKTIELEFGKATLYAGNYKYYVKEKEFRSEILQAAYVNQQKTIAQKEKTINRFMAKATKTSMAQSMQKQLDKLERIEMNPEDNKTMKIYFQQGLRPGRVVMDIQNISKSFGPKKVLKNISIPIERGEKIAFVGQNGKGKTTLAKILVKDLEADSGNIHFGANVQVNYYAQNQADSLDTKKTVLEIMQDAAPPEKRTQIRGILGAFLFSGDDVEKKVSVLSGGERSRLAMAVMIMNPTNVIIMDEPTNHLDIQSKEVLKGALMSWEGTLIIVSHDREFLDGLSYKVYEFTENGIKEYLGDINYFLDKKRVDDIRAFELTKQGGSKPIVQEEIVKIDHEEQKRLKRKIQYLERDIEDLEKKMGKMDEQLKDPEFYASPEFSNVNKVYKETQDKYTLLMAEWETIAAQIV